MFLSIIIPAYNCEKYIDNCIESIMTQDIDKSEYEVIIINDGSTDSTRQKCEKFCENYSNIILINTENYGQSHARNIGIDKASGDYIEFIDSDDYIAHNMFGKLKLVAQENDVDVLYFGVVTTNTYNDFSIDESAELEIYSTGIDLFATGYINNGSCTYWVKGTFLKKNNLKFMEGKYAEDAMFTCSLFSIAGKAVFWDIAGYKYAMNENSTVTKKTRAHQKKMIEDFEFCIYYLNKLYVDMLEKTDNKDYLTELINRIGSYTFFLQMRILRYGDYKKGKQILKKLEENNLYPYRWDAYDKLKLIYKLSNIKIIYLFLLRLMSIKNKLCGIR